MKSPDLHKILSVINPLAVKAGNAIMNVYATNFTVELKNDKSPLTLADMTANEIILEGLNKNFPEYAVLSEESKDDLGRMKNEYCFIVDPLDGTKEFVNRNGQFTVNIALTYQRKSLLGVIYAPALEELYYAYKGGGAFFEDLKQSVKHKITVTDKLCGLVAVGSKSHRSTQEISLFEQKSDVIAKTISIGSSLKGCMVAAGQADIYYRYGLTSEWDVAAMQCIVEEAGGVFVQTDGSPMQYNREDILNRKGFIVANRPENVWI